MNLFEFEGLGTKWAVIVDENFSSEIEYLVKRITSLFEKQYSRFLPESEVGRLNSCSRKEVEVSKELATMLEFGLEIQRLTDGVFNINVAEVLSAYGYDSSYSFSADSERLEAFSPGSIYLKKGKVYKEGKVKVDLGAFGKGYLIDKIADFLKMRGLFHFLIDGGGDIYATHKSDGSGWSIGLEHPELEGRIVGMIELKDQAIASTTGEKRSVGNFNHLIDVKKGKPVSNKLMGVHVVSQRAVEADALSTAIYLCDKNIWNNVVNSYSADYLAIFDDYTYSKSDGFEGEVFSRQEVFEERKSWV